MKPLSKAAMRELRRDYLFLLYEERSAVAARWGMTELFLWTINLKPEETTSNAFAPLRRHLKPHLQDCPFNMIGVIIPPQGEEAHRHGHGVLFLPEGLRDKLEAATMARKSNLKRSYQFKRPDPENGGILGWLHYCVCKHNGAKEGTEFFVSRIMKRGER